MSHYHLKMRLIFAIGVVGAVGLACSNITEAVSPSCAQTNAGMKLMDIEQVLLMNDGGKIISVKSHVADDNQERAMGYQNICKNVIDETTILFVYSKPTNGRFHMRNVNAPLDIGFFDHNGKLIRVLLMKTDAKLYHPGQQFQYALEARSGFFDEFNLSPGSTRLITYSLFDGN